MTLTFVELSALTFVELSALTFVELSALVVLLVAVAEPSVASCSFSSSVFSAFAEISCGKKTKQFFLTVGNPKILVLVYSAQKRNFPCWERQFL